MPSVRSVTECVLQHCMIHRHNLCTYMLALPPPPTSTIEHNYIYTRVNNIDGDRQNMNHAHSPLTASLQLTSIMIWVVLDIYNTYVYTHISEICSGACVAQQ